MVKMYNLCLNTKQTPVENDKRKTIVHMYRRLTGLCIKVYLVNPEIV